MKWFKRLWCYLVHWPNAECGNWPKKCAYCTFIPVELPAREFDWLKDYGPLWEPATTAFWLAPENEAEIRAWYIKYRPNEAQKIYNAGNVKGQYPPAQGALDLMREYQRMGLLQSSQYQHALAQYELMRFRQQYGNKYEGLLNGLF